MIDKLYRVHTFHNSDTISVEELKVLSETPKGYWAGYPDAKKWVAKEGKKVYARANVEDAYTDFIIRRTRQNKFLQAQIRRNEAWIMQAMKQRAQLVLDIKNREPLVSITDQVKQIICSADRTFVIVTFEINVDSTACLLVRHESGQLMEKKVPSDTMKMTPQYIANSICAMAEQYFSSPAAQAFGGAGSAHVKELIKQFREEDNKLYHINTQTEDQP